jgi:hypothetical protein
MVSVTTLILQAFGAMLIAVFIVWSAYRAYHILVPNNRWFRWLKPLPNALNMGIRAFIVFEVMFLIGDLIWFAEPYIHKLFFRLLDAFGVQGTQVGIGVLVIFFGAAAYSFKVKTQFWYGFVEVIFAGVAGVVTARQLNPAAQLAGPIATLIGAVYVVSRGISNIMDARTKKTA